jgi:hypothetical protein
MRSISSSVRRSFVQSQGLVVRGLLSGHGLGLFEGAAIVEGEMSDRHVLVQQTILSCSPSSEFQTTPTNSPRRTPPGQAPAHARSDQAHHRAGKLNQPAVVIKVVALQCQFFGASSAVVRSPCRSTACCGLAFVDGVVPVLQRYGLDADRISGRHAARKADGPRTRAPARIASGGPVSAVIGSLRERE